MNTRIAVRWCVPRARGDGPQALPRGLVSVLVFPARAGMVRSVADNRIGLTWCSPRLEFPDDVHSPVAYIVSQAGDIYLEREEDIRRVTLNFSHLQSAALSVSKSRHLIAAIASELA